MTDIIITAQNPKHGDVDQIRCDFWTGGVPVLFRGKPLAEVAQGDRAYFQYHGVIWGFAFFDRYDHGSGYNLQGDPWESDHAMFLAPPMHRFDVPVDLFGVTRCHGSRYVDPTKYSQETIEELREQTRIAEARPGWFRPFCDYGEPDPDPFPTALMNVVRASIDEEDFLIGTREEVREFIKKTVLPNRKKAGTYEAIAKRVDIDDWDEAIALTLCLLTDDGDITETDFPIIRNGGYLYYNGAQMAEIGPVTPSWREVWEPLRDKESGRVILIDLFSHFVLEDPGTFDGEDSPSISVVQLVRTVVEDFEFAVASTGHVIDIVPRARKKATAAKSKKPTKSKSVKKAASPTKAAKPKVSKPKPPASAAAKAKPKATKPPAGKTAKPKRGASKPMPKAAKPKPPAPKAAKPKSRVRGK